jgi:hypothetical protein
VAGAGLGALIGGLVRTERWQNFPIESLRVGFAAPGGIKFGLYVAL